MNMIKQLKEGKMSIPMFWLTVVFVWVMMLVLVYVGVDSSSRGMENWRMVGMLLLVVVWITAVAFRLRDAGKSPSLVILCFIVPVFALIAGIFPSEEINKEKSEDITLLEETDK